MATRTKPRRRVGKATTRRPARGVRSRTNGAARRAATTRRQPEALRLRSIMPIYTVADLERSIAWYRDGLGFTVKEQWKEGAKLMGVELRAGTCSVGINQDDFAKGRSREKGVGFRIYCDTVQSVEALATRIREFGGRIIMEPTTMPWGARSFAVEDPDGFKISFTESKR
jgi:uncharacterized glyoxalase superfamily protein PhnB